jgi:predicted RNase H-like HicB family nuclease
MVGLVFEVFEDESGGYYAHARIDHHDLYTQGETLDELKRNLDEVSGLYLKDMMSETGQAMPEGLNYSMTFVGRAKIPA